MLKHLVLFSLAGACLTSMAILQAQESPRFAGPTREGFLLPNGWVVSPAGEQIPVADLPLNLLALPDNRHALVATSGYNAHELSLIDLDRKSVVDRQAVKESWFGLASSPEFDRAWWSGGGANVVQPFLLAGNKLAWQGTEPKKDGTAGRPRGKTHFRSGLAVDRQRKVLYSLDIDYGTIAALDLESLKEVKSAPVGTRPYDVAIARHGNQLFVSDWAGRAVCVLDPTDLRTTARIAVGEHPNQ